MSTFNFNVLVVTPNSTFGSLRAAEHDIIKRELGVVFENLSVTGLGAAASYQATLGSTLNPFGILETIKLARHPPTRTILSGFEGVVSPGEMLRMYTCATSFPALIPFFSCLG